MNWKWTMVPKQIAKLPSAEDEHVVDVIIVLTCVVIVLLVVWRTL